MGLTSDVPLTRRKFANLKSLAHPLKIGAVVLCFLASDVSSAEVAAYDFRQPLRDGMILVGMECNHKSKTLEIGIFDAGNPPAKRMDLWKTSDLVAYDTETYMVQDVRNLERTCLINDTHYRVRFEGLPGAANAMWICGAVVTATAHVWKNGRLIFEQDLSRCGHDESVRGAIFSPNSDVPTLVKDTH